MPSDLDLLDLRVVRAIADAGSITGAAMLLGYSQPAVTQRLRRLEDDLGQPVVLRSGRGIALTEAGRRLALHAVHVQAAVDAARQELDELGGATTGTLRLAGFPSASPTLVPAVIAGLGHAHPGLTITYVEAEPPEAIEMIRAGSVDLALTFSYPGGGRTASEATDGIRETALYNDTTMVVVPAGRLSETDGPVDLARLADERFIGGCPRCRGHLLATCQAAGFEPRIVLETDNALAVTGLVAAGLGVALLPRLSLAVAHLPAGVDVHPLPASDDRIVQVAHSAGAERVPAVIAALEVVAALDPAAFGLRPVSRGGRPDPALLERPRRAVGAAS